MLVRWSSEYKEENSIMDVKINLYLQHAGPVFWTEHVAVFAPFLFGTFPLVSRSPASNPLIFMLLQLLIRVLNLLQRAVFSVTFFSGQQKCPGDEMIIKVSLFHKWKSMSIILSECVMDARDGRQSK